MAGSDPVFSEQGDRVEAALRARLEAVGVLNADEVVNVDVTVDELRTRLRQGKVYKPEKVEQALTNFFRKGNLSTLRELALRAVAEEVGSKAAQYRTREGLEPASIPEKVMVCLSTNQTAKKLLRAGSRIAGRLGAVWYAVYVETPRENPSNIKPENAKNLAESIEMAEDLGATFHRFRGSGARGRSKEDRTYSESHLVAAQRMAAQRPGAAPAGRPAEPRTPRPHPTTT